MDLHLGYRFLLVFLIIAANGFFASAEVALISTRQSRLRQLAQERVAGAQAAVTLLANPERLLSVVQVGVTLASLGLGWAGEEPVFKVLTWFYDPGSNPTLRGVLEATGHGVAFLIITYLHVVLGEVVPKNLAIDTADRLAVLVAPPLLVFSRVAGPFVFVIERSAYAVSRALGLHSRAQSGGHSPEEIKFISEASRKQGNLGHFEALTISRLLDLGELSAREIMTPRGAVISAPHTAGIDELLRLFHENKYSRIPIHKGEPDHIIGIVYAKDLLDVWQRRRQARDGRKATPPFRVAAVMRPPLVIPETKPLTQLIETFRTSRSHMALVVDEFGSVSGLVTLEDVLEQVFGEIEDEHDVKPPPLPPRWTSLELDGTTSLRDLATQYDLDLPLEAHYETLAGFLLHRLGEIPEPGDSLEEADVRFTVRAMEGRRIALVRVDRLTAPSASGGETPAND